MFGLHNRRYIGSKTKLLEKINETLKQSFDYTALQNLSFFDVFAGTGVVSHYFMKQKAFNRFLINDFLYSNYVIYQGFFNQDYFDLKKIQKIAQGFCYLDSKKLSDNYYSKNYGNKFFSINDSKIIGFIREHIQELLDNQDINHKEYFILLASLLYSIDKVANTVGHYDAYRKKEQIKDRFHFELIKPIKLQAKIEIFREDSNILAEYTAQDQKNIDITFLDPPYNSRQYSRFYHVLETIAKHNKPELYGVAMKPKPENLSKYCTGDAKKVFEHLIKNLACISKYLVVTYNNTQSANTRSNIKISLEKLQQILTTYGDVICHKHSYKPFSSGKTDFKDHKEYIFVCECRNI